MKTQSIFYLVFAFLLFIPMICYCSIDKDRIRLFLENQYVPEVKLLRAATFAYPDNVTIYLTSDNLLAAYALASLNSPYASEILSTIYNYGIKGDMLHEVLIGIDIPDEFKSASYEIIGVVYSEKFNCSITIKKELRNGSIIVDWYEYADLLVYRALDALLWGSRPYAEELFRKLMSMWDGYGFKDKSFKEKGVYDTYKLALAIYLYRALEAAGSDIIYKYNDIISKCNEIISIMQRNDGGIITDYRVVNGKIVPTGDANTETTSIVVLALYSNYPEILGKKARNKSAISCIEIIPIIVGLSSALMIIHRFTRVFSS